MSSDWLGHLGIVIAVLVIGWSCLKALQANTNTGNIQVWLQLITYYARFWILWLLIWANVQLILTDQTIFWLIIALSLLYLYISWIEPNRLYVAKHTIELLVPKNQYSVTTTSPISPIQHHTNADSQQKPTQLAASNLSSKTNMTKFAVISDIHVGIFSSKKQLERLVICLNTLNVDAVLILGDWLYHAGADLMGQMMILKALNKPCYTVLSQSDNEQSMEYAQNGDYNLYSEQITKVLTTLGVKILSEHAVNIAGIELIGVNDGEGINVSKVIQQQADRGKPLIIMTHDIKQLEANPRTLSGARDNTLILAGQTHGGQVNIPILTPLLVRILTGNRRVAGLRRPDLHKADSTNSVKAASQYQVWINTGIGMTGLPFRFNCPPRIDVLTIKVSEV